VLLFKRTWEICGGTWAADGGGGGAVHVAVQIGSCVHADDAAGGSSAIVV